MPQKVRLVFNPIANLGRAWSIAPTLRSIANEMGNVDWTVTAYPIHATELAASAAEEGYDLVVAMGGDGTMHEVLNGLMQVPVDQRPKMGIVPLGSGNDFAYSCGISPKPEDALRQALTGNPHSVDVGRMVDHEGHTHFWANAVGIGFDTIVTLDSRHLKFFQGFMVYFLAVLQTILFQYEPFHLKMKIDDSDWEKSLIMLVLMNGKREGGGFHVTPDSKSDDGLLDLLAIDKVSRLRLLRILPEILNGTQAKLSDCHFRQYSILELESDRPLYVHADGEIIATPKEKCKHLSINILKNGIQVVR